jgi:hypothetical protein
MRAPLRLLIAFRGRSTLMTRTMPALLAPGMKDMKETVTMRKSKRRLVGEEQK